jgi:hypothetical protein
LQWAGLKREGSRPIVMVGGAKPKPTGPFWEIKVQMRQSLWEDMKMPEGTKVAQPKTYEGFFNWGTGSEYLLFWQCAIVEIRCIGNMPNQIKVPMLYFHHSAMCKSINRNAIARMKLPLASFSELTKCQSFCCK